MKLYHVKKARKEYPCEGGDRVEIGEPYHYANAKESPTGYKCWCPRHSPSEEVPEAKAKETAARPETEIPSSSPRSDSFLTELNATTPIAIHFADGCEWGGVLSTKMDEAIARHRTEHPHKSIA